MKVLLLGPYNQRIVDHLVSLGDEVHLTEEDINPGSAIPGDTEFLLSYRYRHIIGEKVLERFRNRAINLHISFLPWNRGADPNLWSFLEDTPKGVSIHYLDKGLDTGPILLQEEVQVKDGDTLRTMYDRLSKTIEDLLIENWRLIREGSIESFEQAGEGSSHALRDRARFETLLTDGWDTPVHLLAGKALEQS